MGRALRAYDCRIAQFLSAFNARQYSQALTALGNISEPENQINALLGMCYEKLGREREARRAMSAYLAAAPHEVADYPGDDREQWRSYWRRTFPFREQADQDHLLDSFMQAAFPCVHGESGQATHC